MSVVIETTIGDITVDLYVKERPSTCLNFLKLCKVKFYNLCLFYKIEKNFIAQTGDPSATGRGGESVFCRLYGDQAKYFDAEFKPRLKHEKLGTLSMVNNGNNMNGSQFFLTLSENLTYLDENHSVFGEVAEGFDVLLKLNDAICDGNNRPYQDIRITHTVVLHDPFEDPKGLEIPGASPEPTKEMLESDYIRADEEIDDTKGKTAEEIEEKIKESEAKARATILEMVGDIPDAEVKPPENVLFVCKLNPVTTSEDLEVIFSRFGKILSCEVIKDKKTGESLQYAFIEFEREEDCEAAYFKMDNVLIDDRRIHVDFSQSVSKLYFNRNNLSNKNQPKSNLMLKSSKKTDSYDLIFEDESNAINSKSRKSKSSESDSKHKSWRDNRKHSASSDEYKDKRKRRMDREEYSHPEKKIKDDKIRKHNSEKKKEAFIAQKHGNREKDYFYESNKSTGHNINENKCNYYDKNRELKQYREDKYDKRYDDQAYSYDTKRSYDYKSKSSNSSDIQRSDRDSKSYKKSSYESHSRKHTVSHERNPGKSVSPDFNRKSYKSKVYSPDYSHTKRKTNGSDSEEYATQYKTSTSKHRSIAEDSKSTSHKQKKDKKERHHSSKKPMSKTSRSVSVSSSSSSTSYSSSSSSSSSDSMSDPSAVSSHAKHSSKYHSKDKKCQNSKKISKSLKKKNH